MAVEKSTGRDTDGATGRRSGGSHRADRRGPSPLLLVGALAVVAVAVVVGFLVLGGSGSTDQQADAADGSAGAPQQADPAAGASGGGGGGQVGPGSSASELAVAESSISAGESLVGNPALDLADAERTEMEQGRVDIRVLSLLALLAADHELGVADFSAPQDPDGARPAYVVDLDTVDGEPVDAAPAGDVARIARGQLGVYRPDDVSVRGDVLRIAFVGRDTEDLPPVPLSP